MRDPSCFAWPEGVRAAVSLSFDDGRASQLDQGLPILDRYGVKATFYMTPAAMDQQLSHWQRVADAGHEIGNHSSNHVCSGNFCWLAPAVLEDYTLEHMEQDILAAQEGIRERLGLTPRTFAYPCGQSFVGRGEQCKSYVPLVARHFVAGRRFRDEHFNDPSFCDLARLAGTEGDGLTFDDLQALLDRAVAEGAWLTLAMHDVGQPGRPQTIWADTLERLCAYCTDQANGLWIDTVERIAETICQTRSDG